MPSTPSSSSASTASRTSSSRSGSTSLPNRSMRPRTPWTRSRGTSGVVVVVGGDVQAVGVGVAEVGLDAALHLQRVLLAGGDDHADVDGPCGDSSRLSIAVPLKTPERMPREAPPRASSPTGAARRRRSASARRSRPAASSVPCRRRSRPVSSTMNVSVIVPPASIASTLGVWLSVAILNPLLGPSVAYVVERSPGPRRRATSPAPQTAGRTLWEDHKIGASRLTAPERRPRLEAPCARRSPSRRPMRAASAIEEILAAMTSELDEVAQVLTDTIHEHLDELDDDMRVGTLQSVRSNLGVMVTMLRRGHRPAPRPCRRRRRSPTPRSTSSAASSFELLQRAYRTAQGVVLEDDGSSACASRPTTRTALPTRSASSTTGSSPGSRRSSAS